MTPDICTQSRRRFSLVAFLALFILSFSTSGGAIETLAQEAILIDAETGAVLFDKNANTPMAPASMSKLMTVYMVLERLRDGRLSLDDT
ncbi:MAG: serine hydrolase, partial [Alphaproteobacteria bacterium]